MIYCVEDDASIRELIIYTLETAGFEAAGFNDGSEMFEALAEAEKSGTKFPQLILLDVMLPGDDGIEILKRLRNDLLTEDIPVIMETAKGTEVDTIKALDRGADDYLAKPFGMMEMVARVKAVLRRTERKNVRRDIISAGGLSMDMQGHRVSADGSEIHLTLKEFEILRMMMQNPGRVYSREDMLSSIWGIDFLGETRTVDVHVGTLRTKLGDCGRYIETVRGVGYRFTVYD